MRERKIQRASEVGRTRRVTVWWTIGSVCRRETVERGIKKNEIGIDDDDDDGKINVKCSLRA